MSEQPEQLESAAEDRIVVRPATYEDLPAILEIYNDAVLKTTASFDEEPRTLEERIAWYEEHLRDRYPVFVAVDAGGRVLGWSSLSEFRTRIAYRFTAEDSIYVAEEARGRGIGTKLMAPLLKAARERGLHAIIAGVDAENQASLRLHAAFGFERVAHLKQVGFKFGRWLDVIYMELLVDHPSGM